VYEYGDHASDTYFCKLSALLIEEIQLTSGGKSELVACVNGVGAENFESPKVPKLMIFEVYFFLEASE
jgi:hypothetical protein